MDLSLTVAFAMMLLFWSFSCFIIGSFYTQHFEMRRDRLRLQEEQQELNKRQLLLEQERNRLDMDLRRLSTSGAMTTTPAPATSRAPIPLPSADSGRSINEPLFSEDPETVLVEPGPPRY